MRGELKVNPPLLCCCNTSWINLLLLFFPHLFLVCSCTDNLLCCTFLEFAFPSMYDFQVLLGEVNAGLSTTQVVVKELKASASVQDQMQFLEEAQPYRLVHKSI